jgi:hypothetical protein
MNADVAFNFSFFSGINTVDDSTRLTPSTYRVGAFGEKTVYPLVSATNVEIDNTYALKSRDGSTLELSGSDVHSLWSDNDLCFFVDGNTLYKLNIDYTKTSMIEGLQVSARMSYVVVNDRVYMTNGSYIGYYNDGAMHSLQNPSLTYKVILPPGQYITYLSGRLYVAKGSVLYAADVLCDHYDIRTGFYAFANDITMLRAVENGIYVCDGDIWFLSDGGEAGMKREFISNDSVIPFTDAGVDGLDVGEDGFENGTVAIWVSSSGVQMGTNKGKVVNITPNYIIPPPFVGAAMIRSIDGVTHYIATIN